MTSEVQSVVFKRGQRTKKEQAVWLTKHGFATQYPGKPTPDENKTQIRYRQTDPSKYHRFGTLKIRPDIALIIGHR